MNLEIAKVLTLSTKHITPRDGVRLNRLDSEFDDVPHVVYNTDCFHLVWTLKDEVKVDAHDQDQPAMSPAFQALVKLAQDNDCEWLKLDCDGPVVPGLPTFEW